tara:strand:+ start:180 stop:371 length:192 start_codon:yes stop_codon:yes gene_type:complete
MKKIIEVVKTLIKPSLQNSKLGRWNLQDNIDIKMTLANMDCCGDALCGKPEHFSKTIETILKK